MKEVVATGVETGCPSPRSMKSCAVNDIAAPRKLGELRLQLFSVFFSKRAPFLWTNFSPAPVSANLALFVELANFWLVALRVWNCKGN